MKTKSAAAVVVFLLFVGGAQAQWTVGGGGAIYYNGGNVGIGTTTPVADLHVKHTAADAQVSMETGGLGNYAYGRFTIPANASVNDTQAGFLFQEGAGNYTAGNRFWAFGFNPVTDTFQILGGGSASAKLTVNAIGNVGIGTNAPGSKLDVNGNININGNVVASGNIAAKYQDLAEWVPSSEHLTPGTVVVLNPNKSNEVMASTSPYDTSVAGVVSSAPGVILGVAASNKEQIATTGRVRIRVDATGAAISIGDLLVTSGKEGIAMKSQPVEVGGIRMHRPGTIVGKALESLKAGQGEILVLLTLQ